MSLYQNNYSSYLLYSLAPPALITPLYVPFYGLRFKSTVTHFLLVHNKLSYEFRITNIYLSTISYNKGQDTQINGIKISIVSSSKIYLHSNHMKIYGEHVDGEEVIADICILSSLLFCKFTHKSINCI